jgi:hypothetical protein
MDLEVELRIERLMEFCCVHELVPGASLTDDQMDLVYALQGGVEVALTEVDNFQAVVVEQSQVCRKL